MGRSGLAPGFPAWCWRYASPDRRAPTVHLVESDQRKCAFLREVARATGAPRRNSRCAHRILSPRQPNSCGRRHGPRARPLAHSSRLRQGVADARGRRHLSSRQNDRGAASRLSRFTRVPVRDGREQNRLSRRYFDCAPRRIGAGLQPVVICRQLALRRIFWKTAPTRAFL